jgi:hypothetical protein
VNIFVHDFSLLFVFRRVKTMLEQRQSLIEERRKSAIMTRLQKEAIAKMMEEVRTNASKASKIINQAVSGKFSLDTILQKSRSPSASKSRSPGKGKGSKKDLLVKTDEINLGRSKSAIDRQNVESSSNLVYSAPPTSLQLPFVSPYSVPVTEH